jgi:hypothetical protein
METAVCIISYQFAICLEIKYVNFCMIPQCLVYIGLILYIIHQAFEDGPDRGL